jgi:hypothetical protein
MNLMRSLDDYEQLLAPARERFAVSPGVRAIASTSDDVFLELFLLHFCALGSQMTEPVERWIRRAAERCVTVGFPVLARALKGHAQAEAGHHLMMIADVRSLAARWNACRKPSVDVGELLKEAPSPGVLHDRKVHEENIAGDTPYAQIAIEYEVEMLPLRYGELLLNRCDVIFVQDTQTNDVQKITSEPNKDNFRIVAVHPNANPKLFEAVISDGSEQGSVKFRFATPKVVVLAPAPM